MAPGALLLGLTLAACAQAEPAGGGGPPDVSVAPAPAQPAASPPSPLQGRLGRSPVVSGSLWGKIAGEAAAALGHSTSAAEPGLSPEAFLREGFWQAWGVRRSSAAEAGLEWVRLSTSTRLLLREGRVFGYLERRPVDTWDDYEIPARARFGDPAKRHFTLPDPEHPGLNRFFHLYIWQDARTRYEIVKVTDRDTLSQWTEARTGTRITLRVMQPREGEDTPFFVGAFSATELRALDRLAGPKPRRR